MEKSNLMKFTRNTMERIWAIEYMHIINPILNFDKMKNKNKEKKGC